MSETTHNAYRIVGTAGHIDHGKSALVEALTGTDPDRLREEKERGITIDLGFADLDLGTVHVGFIDVPGHERFVKNMLAGIGGIDAVLLVVAGDESIMPQTREHFAIVRLLGIQHGVVAITKRDLVDDEIAELVELEVRDLLAGSALEQAPVVRTSVTTGEGLDELRTALTDCLAATGVRPADGVLRLPVDRVFTVRGFGTVITGTVLSGAVAVGDGVELLPTGQTVTVRGIQVHGDDTQRAVAGQRAALNLQGVQVDEIGRGAVIGHPATLRASHMLDARLEVLGDVEHVEHLQRVRFHHGAAELLGRVAVLEGSEVRGGSSGLVQLRLESPYPAAPGDHFIVRRYSPVITIGGGVIIDPAPVKHRPGAAAVAMLARIDRGSDADRLHAWIHDAGIAGIDRLQLQQRLVRPAEHLDALLRQAEADGTIVLAAGSQPRAVAGDRFADLEQQLLDALADYHGRYPLRPAAPKEELRARVDDSPPVEIVDAALTRLCSSDRARTAADGFALVQHLVRLPAAAATTRDALLNCYSRARLAPPTPEQALAASGDDQEQTREVFHHLLREGQLVRVKEDLVVHSAVLEQLIDDLGTHFPRGAQFTVGDFKEWASLSRKHAIPLLEYLDSQRITRRIGDSRERL